MRFKQAALVAVLCLTTGMLWARPKWTTAKPHYETRGGRVFAVAVGKAKDKNEALARAVAEERARAELARLLQGKPLNASVEEEVKGGRVVEVYNAGRGVVYVRLALETPRRP